MPRTGWTRELRRARRRQALRRRATRTHRSSVSGRLSGTASRPSAISAAAVVSRSQRSPSTSSFRSLSNRPAASPSSGTGTSPASVSDAGPAMRSPWTWAASESVTARRLSSMRSASQKLECPTSAGWTCHAGPLRDQGGSDVRNQRGGDALALRPDPGGNDVQVEHGVFVSRMGPAALMPPQGFLPLLERVSAGLRSTGAPWRGHGIGSLPASAAGAWTRAAAISCATTSGS